MSSKKFIAVVFGCFLLVVGFVGGVNYLVDPLWTFNHSNQFNNAQNGFDERQQKTNYVYNRGLDEFDGILLGSSRTTFYNQNDFGDMKIYNYASSSMFPYEYKGYINFAKEIKGKDFKYIIIGADFFGTNVPKDVKFENPEFYIKNTTSFSYRYKMLLSTDALKKSIVNIKNTLKSGQEYYDRNNVKYQPKVSESERLERYTTNLKRHTMELSYPKYVYNENYLDILKEIKRDNPNTKFIIFTSAITSDLLVSIIKNGNRMQEYERWLRELIEVFGEVHHFMTINSITKNLENYPDDDHAYPHIVKFAANKIANIENSNIPEDFGVLVTKQNIDQHLKNLKEQIKAYDLNKSAD
mgnify:CR=1 FL=1